MKTVKKPIHKIFIKAPALAVLITGTFITLVILLARTPVDFSGIDWTYQFRPATLLLLSGKSPYDQFGFFNAPWVMLIFAPLALLPERLGYGLIGALNFFAAGFVIHRMGAKPVPFALLILSPHILAVLLYPNLDWIAALGFVLPPQIGLFFLLIKPQIGWAVGIFWLFESWRLGGWRQVIRVFAPVTLVLLLSFALFGAWPLNSQRVTNIWYNQATFPLTASIGLMLVVYAIKTRSKSFAILASPLLSPYLASYSWGVAATAFLPSTPETIAAVIGLWVIEFLAKNPPL